MTVVADGSATVLRIAAPLFEQLTGKAPGFGQAIAKRAIQRMNQLVVMGAPRAPVVAAPEPSKAAAGVVPFVEVGDYNPSGTVLNALTPRLYPYASRPAPAAQGNSSRSAWSRPETRPRSRRSAAAWGRSTSRW